MKAGKFIWGLIILSVGVILIGINMGWWDQTIWNWAYSYWPVILILLGLAMIFDNAFVFLAVIIIVGAGIFYLYRTDYRHFRENSERLFPAPSINIEELINRR